jgi:hypothetical protein
MIRAFNAKLFGDQAANETRLNLLIAGKSSAYA